MLVFTHIPKTGGTTINLNYIEGTRPVEQIRIKANYEKNEVYTFTSGKRRSPSIDWPPVSFEVPSSDIVRLTHFLHSSQIQGVKCIKGHLPYGVHNYIDERCYYFTVVREPVARVWSLFNGVRNDKGHYLHELWRDKYHWDLKGILLSEPPEICNDQYRMLVGTSRVKFFEQDEKKIPEILDNYSYVITPNRINSVGSDFGYLFGWKYTVTKKSFNVGRYDNVSSSKPSPQLIKMIADYNRIDIALYNYVKEKGIIFNLSKGEPFYDRDN